MDGIVEQILFVDFRSSDHLLKLIESVQNREALKNADFDIFQMQSTNFLNVTLMFLE